MPAIRMQTRYWKLILPAIDLAKKDLEQKYEHWEQIMKNASQFTAEEQSAYSRRMLEIKDDIKRYDAIREKVEEASKKHDSFFSNGIGPDEPDYPELTSSDEEKLRWLEQID